MACGQINPKSSNFIFIFYHHCRIEFRGQIFFPILIKGAGNVNHGRMNPLLLFFSLKYSLPGYKMVPERYLLLILILM